MSTRIFMAAAMAAVAIGALHPTAAKADVEWTGAADDGGNVLTAENWSGNAAPGSGDTVAIGEEPEANLSNGSATYYALKLGSKDGKTGTLTVGKDGELACKLWMGFATGSVGVLTINGGKVSFTDIWTRDCAARSTINMIDGEFKTGTVQWGIHAQGHAEFIQSGGTVTLNNDTDMLIGQSGPASYMQTGGDLTCPRWFSIGRYSTGNGTYTITGGTLTLTSNVADLQIGDEGKGVFTLEGNATVTVAHNINFGNKSGANGTANLNGGSVKASEMNIGNADGASGTVNLSGSSMEAKYMNVGKVSGASGTLNLSGGSMKLSQVMHIGYQGDGTVTQNGGIVTESDTVKVAFANTSTSSYTLDAGTNQMANAMIVGDSGKGFFMMGGGTLKTPQIQSGLKASGSGRMFLNGGTFMPTKAGSIFANGAGVGYWTLGRDFTIDTDGKDVSSAVSMLATSGSSLTKDGDGKLMLAALPQADSVTVAKGTIALSSGGDNTVSSATLAHRWSFSGNANDSVGGATGKLVGTAAYTDGDTAVLLPGGNNGTSYVNLGKGLIVGDNLTLEFWAKRVSVKKWARVFECGTGQSNYLMASWVNANDGNSDKLSVRYGNTEYADTAKMAFADDEMVHLAIRYVKNSDGTMTLTWTKRSVDGNGSIVKTSTFTPDGLDKNWTLDKVAPGDFFLGHSSIWNDNDANAVYDEVRVWYGALSDDALTLSAQTGPDATAEQIAAIVAKNDESMSVERKIAIAASATLDLGGNTLTQPVLDVGGTLANGKLIVTKGLIVTPGQTMTVADGATLDLSAVSEVSLKDDSAAIPAEGWVIATSSSGTVVPAEARSLTGDLKGYTLFMRGDQSRIGKRGFMILFR